MISTYTIEIVAVAMLSASILLAWVFFARYYMDYRIGLLRYRLFMLRDNFFDAAANGKIDFNSEAYGLTRTTINGMLRMSHRLTITNVFILRYLVYSRSQRQILENTFNNKLDSALDKLSKDERKLVLSVFVRAHICILAHLFAINPILVFFTWLLNNFINLKNDEFLQVDKDLVETKRSMLLRGNRASQQWKKFDAQAKFADSYSKHNLKYAA